MKRSSRPSSAVSPDPAPRPSFSADDLVSALSAALQRESACDGLSTAELIQRLGWTKTKVDTALNRLFAAGKLEAKRVNRPSRDGSYRQHVLYTIRAA